MAVTGIFIYFCCPSMYALTIICFGSVGKKETPNTSKVYFSKSTFLVSVSLKDLPSDDKSYTSYSPLLDVKYLPIASVKTLVSCLSAYVTSNILTP